MPPTNLYLATLRMPQPAPAELIERIPRQQARVQELLTAGTITSYTLALDRSTLWVTLRAESSSEALGFLASFPIIDWADVDLKELAFQQHAESQLPRFSLN
jgi:muconolactone delta-isomerase